MSKTVHQAGSAFSNLVQLLSLKKKNREGTRAAHPFRVMVQKEMADHITSWRFLILIGIIFLTCIGSMYTALTGLQKADAGDAENAFFFLKLFTVSDGTLPSFFLFIAFLGPLLGISMGFDSVNSEQNRGTLSRILAQPVPRDYVINTKFTGALLVIGALLFALSFLVIGSGLIALGTPPTAGEFMRIMLFTLISIIYVSFWLNLSVFFSIRFKQPATSALAGIAVWLFFVVFYPLILNIITRALQPSPFASERAVTLYEKLKFLLVQVMPNELYNEAVSTMLTPSVRSLGPLTIEQLHGAIPGPLPLGQSLLVIWPQITGLVAITALCFILSYTSFMRKEIRSGA
ncbi:MAG TPA: ABC transporter permease [Bacteroidetes bacterium]|nr:ABC transporter permease [Bacteroidota bacterium]